MPAENQANRAILSKELLKIEQEAQDRCHALAELIVQEIATNPATPYDRNPRRPPGPRMRDSYYVDTDPATGDALIKSTSRYWAFVEYGTGNHDAQPHLNPAVDLIAGMF